jgi:broad specificity phosphatase PhoE
MNSENSPSIDDPETIEKPRVVIYIRHGKDKRGKYKYDEKLTKIGKFQSKQLAYELIEKYGIPDAIYCSPFYRTRQTRRQMLKVISKYTDKKIVNKTDPRLGRFFTKSQMKDPDIRSDTMKKKAQIYETWDEFKKRVYRQLRDMENKTKKYPVIWCIGHTLIIKRVAKYKNINRPSHIEYSDTVILVQEEFV